ncbi:hypothetical protein IA06_00785 [Flavobacterium psychrophilum]|nr:hypothetical protein IA06_00785 [Flavobacterium psychrophilum]
MKKLLFFILIPFLGIAQDFTANGINYTITSSVAPFTVSVDKNPGFTGVAEIPETVAYNSENYAVTDIVNYAFEDCIRLTSIRIGNAVTSIGDFAFLNCTGLTSIRIGDAVTSIGDFAFNACTGLTSVTIPNSVTTIGIAAFGACAGLTSITIPNSVTTITIGDYAFNSCPSLTTINCYTTTPLVINPNVFGDTNQSACTLNVPAGTEAVYQATEIWQDFSPITGGFLSSNSFAIESFQALQKAITL